MVEPLTVNEAIENLATLAGRDVSIIGLFTFQFEDVSLNHWPRGEQRAGYQSSIWISTGMGSLQFDELACKRLSGKRVVVQGTLYQPDPKFGGCGHFSLWPAEILARTLEAA
jgi:hypothetical protein